MLSTIVNGELLLWDRQLAVAASTPSSAGLHIVILPLSKLNASRLGGCIEIRAVGKQFGDEIALHHIDLDEEQHSGPPKAIVLAEATRAVLHYSPPTRRVDHCLEHALKSAVAFLKKGSKADDDDDHNTADNNEQGDGNNSRVGAVPFEELAEAVGETIGTDRLVERLLFGNASWLKGVAEISAFNTASTSTTACVSKHPSAKEPQQQQLQVHDLWFNDAPPLNASELVDLCNADTFSWRTVAASFSTMMRYFQKSKTDFTWRVNDACKTILRAAS